MSSLISTGSPKLSKKASAQFTILEEEDENQGIMGELPANKHSRPSNGSPSPLRSSKLGNIQPMADGQVDLSNKKPKQDHSAPASQATTPSTMDDILSRLRASSAQPSKPASTPDITKARSMDQILADLNEKQGALKKQQSDLAGGSGHKEVEISPDRSSESAMFTPATESFISTGETSEVETPRVDAAEMLRVKQELAAARSVINRQEQELAESRNFKHTLDQALGPPSEADFGSRADVTEQTITNLQSAFNASARPFAGRTDNWAPQEDARSDVSDALSAGAYNRARGVWNNNAQSAPGTAFNVSGAQQNQFTDFRPIQPGHSGWNTGIGQGMLGQGQIAQTARNFSNPTTAAYGFDQRFVNDPHQLQGNRRVTAQYGRSGAAFGSRNPGLGGYNSGLPGMAQAGLAPIGYGPVGYQPRPMGSGLSPTASEFTAPTPLASTGNPWGPHMNTNAGQTYVTPLEPLNYRRLLDKSVTCDWKYIVDKIVCSNDQQASIFLQQKLKVGTAEQKFEIVEAIVNQAYPLMINRFGNFLVQRCFEHGTPEQVVAIADAIHGNVLSLSMDAFGCHVIQKAFDSVPEEHKAEMVRELLRRIPDTVIHRYACHVWQKLFELRWSGEPPQIMTKVNEALQGMWHEVALGETGSLVVQNIFENCVEEEKRPAIEEVISSIDLIAHGQFGNWCIQHLCEHGSPPDKRRVVDHILANAYNYSIDQFASKVVEKCLKIGGIEFLERYLGAITTAHPDRPRIPLIDIAGDQYGNYLIQWILMNTHHHQREQVAIHIRKHMVSLRGSKFGSRVAMLCCNPASVTRPGPGVVVNPFGAPGQPRGWGRYR